jgi:hypothetical protein
MFRYMQVKFYRNSGYYYFSLHMVFLNINYSPEGAKQQTKINFINILVFDKIIRKNKILFE